MNQRVEIVIAGAPDRENLVVEVYVDHVQIAEFRNEGDAGPMAEIYPNPHAASWAIPIDTLCSAFAEAKRQLESAPR